MYANLRGTSGAPLFKTWATRSNMGGRERPAPARIYVCAAGLLLAHGPGAPQRQRQERDNERGAERGEPHQRPEMLSSHPIARSIENRPGPTAASDTAIVR
jgi:hypothetical protein